MTSLAGSLITQDHRLVYDSLQVLCRVIRPESCGQSTNRPFPHYYLLLGDSRITLQNPFLRDINEGLLDQENV